MNKLISTLIFLTCSVYINAQTVYSGMAAQYAAEGNFEKAIELELEGMDIYKKIHGEKQFEYAISLSNVGYYYFRNGNIEESIKFNTNALKFFNEILEPNHPSFAASYYRQAVYISAKGNHEDAIGYCQRALKIIEESIENDNTMSGLVLLQLALCYSELGNYSEAVDIATKAIENLEKSFGKVNAFYLSASVVLAKSLAQIGDYSKALILANEQLVLTEKFHGNQSNEYITSLNNLVIINFQAGNYNEALRNIKTAISTYIYLNGTQLTQDYIEMHVRLALIYEELKQYQKAITVYNDLLSIYDLHSLNNESKYAGFLNNLSNCYAKLENYENAVFYAKKALEIKRNINGETSLEYAHTLNNIAKLYNQYGDFPEAINMGEQVLNILEGLDDSEVSDKTEMIIALTNMLNYYDSGGAYENAISFGEKALTISLETFGELSIFSADLYNDLSGCYFANGECEKAYEYINKAIEIRKKLLGEKDQYYLASVMNLAIFLSKDDKPEEALHIMESVNQNSTVGSAINMEIYSKFLKTIATMYVKLNQFQDATDNYNKALAIEKKLYGVNHIDIGRTYMGLSLCNFKKGNLIELVNASLEINKIWSDYIEHGFRFLPAKEKTSFWSSYKTWFIVILPLYNINYPFYPLNSLAYNGILLSKGILLNSEIEFDKFLVETGNETLLEKYNEIKSLRLQLNKLYEKPIAERYVDTDSLERNANELERQLMQESAEFGDYTRNLTITWEDIRDNLKEKDAAIEFVSFPLNNDSTMYMAYVLRPGVEAPELVKLFEERDLTNLIDEDDVSSIYTNKSASELIWGKLRSQLEGVENIYFAPDGVLHQIAIEYFPDIDEEGMISDSFNLHRLSSTREIVVNKHYAPVKEAVVYGGIKYDTDVATMETESRKYERPKHRGFSTYYNLGDSLTLRGSLEYLGGSLTEAENINGMMKENNYNSLFLSGNDATEESFKSLSGKANGIIHISTHGFYWTESEAERKASLNDQLMFMSQMGDNARKNVEDKALIRTGLFMAGAKNALGGVELPEDVDDGILTAQEIANLDLRGLDLVVLSACQTGMGDISGDGVFGLQRGFKKAGSNTILMSLWDVSDEATQILMTNFYKNYLGGMSKQQALREAQKTVRETPGFSEPEFWAAFILLDALN